MGIYSRDYIRESRSGFLGGSDNWAIRYLLIANAAVFVLQLLTTRSVQSGPFLVSSSLVTESLDLSAAAIFQRFQLWRLVTYGFCHDSVMHIAFNMYFLWLFGQRVEPIYRSREFLAFYLTAIVLAGLAFIGVNAAGGSSWQPVVGASGGVMAMVVLAAMYYPRDQILFMMFIPLEFRWLALIYVLGDVSGFVRGGDNVAHISHLAGAAFAAAYKYFDWRIVPLFDRVRGSIRNRSRAKLRVYEPPKTESRTAKDLEAEVDRILQKISTEGEESLTSREREILKDASRRYRNRS